MSEFDCPLLYYQYVTPAGATGLMSPAEQSLPLLLLLLTFQKNLQHLQSLLLLQDFFILPEDLLLDFVNGRSGKDSSCKGTMLRCVVFLLLLISGNIHPNPGPDIQCLSTLFDFKNISGLGLHLNVRSLDAKMDTVKIWVASTDADIIVISEIWLRKSIVDKDIVI